MFKRAKPASQTTHGTEKHVPMVLTTVRVSIRTILHPRAHTPTHLHTISIINLSDLSSSSGFEFNITPHGGISEPTQTTYQTIHDIRKQGSRDDGQAGTKPSGACHLQPIRRSYTGVQTYANDMGARVIIMNADLQLVPHTMARKS